MKNIISWSLSAIFFLAAFFVYSGDAVAAETAKILFLKGSVEVKRAGAGDWTTAYKNMELAGGDVIKTGRASWAEIALDKDLGNIIKVDANTEIALDQLLPVRLNLVTGSIYSLVEKLDKGSTFEVRTPVAVCGVRGSGQGTKTDANTTTVSAYENDGFAKGVDKDGNIMEDNIIVKEGFKTIVKKFEKPTKLEKLSKREKKMYRSWRGKLNDKLAGMVGGGKPDKLKKLGLAADKFKKVIDKKEDMLDKRDADKIEKTVTKSGSDSGDNSCER